MKHLSTLIAVKNLTIIQFTKIIQDLFYLDEFILDSLIIHLENCTIYHDESAIAFCIQYQNNDHIPVVAFLIEDQFPSKMNKLDP